MYLGNHNTPLPNDEALNFFAYSLNNSSKLASHGKWCLGKVVDGTQARHQVEEVKSAEHGKTTVTIKAFIYCLFYMLDMIVRF